jgi:hypothetical protein
MHKQIARLMQAEDVAGVDFFDFAEQAEETMAYADDNEHALVQCVLAVLSGNDAVALAMAERFRGPLEQLAKKMLESAVANQRH